MMSPSPGSQAGEETDWRTGGRPDSKTATMPTATVPRCRMTVVPPFGSEVVGEVQLDASGQHGARVQVREAPGVYARREARIALGESVIVEQIVDVHPDPEAPVGAQRGRVPGFRRDQVEALHLEQIRVVGEAGPDVAPVHHA